jgi:hypothetical protein
VPPGRLLHGAAYVIATILILDAAWPGDFACVTVPAALVGLLLIATWLVGALICIGFAHRRKRGSLAGGIAWRQWLKLPVITGLTIAVLWFGLPWRLTFWLSRSAMDGFAARAMPVPVGTHLPDTWVGLYRARNVWRTQNGVQFWVRGSGFVDQEGWAYFPNGPPPPTKDDTFTHVAGSWYLLHWRF